MNIGEMLGQKLIFGFHGSEMTEEFISLIREYKIGNVILFRRNIKSAEQLRKLCSDTQKLILEETGHPAFIVIDQEGGMVTRLPQEAVNVPCEMAIAATGDPGNAAKAAQITIRQLKGLGPNFNMAPVLDVNNNPHNPVIGIRSFGDNAESAAAFGAESVKAYAQSGILCCGKHFPGHGDTAVDSHLGLPKVDKTEEALEQLELIPFRRAVEAGIPAIMISHVLFPNIEKYYVPSTMSRKIVTGMLREKMGFQGLILTDCMEMGAIQNFYGTPEGTVAAIKAGVDLAGISSTIGLEWAAAMAVNEAAERGEFDEEEIRASVERILRYKAQICYEVQPELCNWESDRETVRWMAARAITCCEGAPFLADEKTFFCGCADYRASGAENEDGTAGCFSDYMCKAFRAAGLVTPKNPNGTQILQVLAEAQKYEKLVFSTCNGHLFHGQIALAEALAAMGKPMMVVALRNPYDIPLLPACTCKIAAYDYTTASFQSLEAVFRGESMTGILPVKL